jgi:probable LLM family oxidoreductase
MQIGVFSFAECDGPERARHRLRDLVEEAVLAEQVGLDVFGVGEHHRPDFIASAPAVVLAAIAARTERIRLTSAVSVISSDDPVRVFQQFATLDLLSEGRAEITAGRGSFIESFPLFGYRLEDYDALFEEKLELLLRLRGSERITWSGRHRPPLQDAGVYPRPLQEPLPVWIAVGGTPRSVARAGVLGLPLAIAILGGEYDRFAPFTQLYRRALTEAGHDPRTPLSINTPTYVAGTPERAAAEHYPGFAAVMDRIGRERGWGGRMTLGQYDELRSPAGALPIGSPEQVAEKILAQHAVYRHDRHMAQISVGPMPHAQVMRAIELLGTEVAPRVRAEVARRDAATRARVA